MRKFFVLLLFVSVFCADALAATRPASRANARSGATATSATASKKSAVSARAARTAPVAVAPKTASTAAKPGVTARAATKQKVINTGTKVAAATQNILISSECREKYDGCMDAVCMLDNVNGGRCACSDKNAELDAVLAEIEKLDQQSYQMATFGVEKIEMGMFANDAIAAANQAAEDVLNKEKKNQAQGDAKKVRALDLSLWDLVEPEVEEEAVFASTALSSLEGKSGDALYTEASKMCTQMMPECEKDFSMLQLLYAQRIKSDCAAYENSLKQQKNSSAQKLQAAERALREAALEQLQNANKYDLGECTVEFKKCMQTTAGCGDDFSSCAVISAMDNTSTRKSTSKQAKNYQIKGAVTNIEISASTYDILISKKPLCESVTKSCVAVSDKVWDTFLREVAPQVKSAELIAEDKARQDCIGNISSCFQKACKDNIDPKDKDGSYDMCLSRPGTMLNVCKIPLNNCGIDASSEAAAEQSDIWDFVLARLAAMRVNSCTAEVKECLQSEDRCGEDYTQCIGLDTDSIIRMCPYDTLTGCQKVYGEENIRGNQVYDELANMVQGIMLGIDNSLMEECQKAANEAMIKVCGDTENCDQWAVDENIGPGSLEYRICEYGSNGSALEILDEKCRPNIESITDNELGRVQGSLTGELGPVKPFVGLIEGIIYWANVDVKEDGLLSGVDEYLQSVDMENIPSVYKDRIKNELASLQKNINNAVDLIEADPKVQFCMTGREVQGMDTRVETSKGKNSKKKTEVVVRQNIGKTGEGNARFPQLTKQMRMIIANAALMRAKENYYKEYDKLNSKMSQDYATLGERIAKISGENAKDVRREAGRQACVDLARSSNVSRTLVSNNVSDFSASVSRLLDLNNRAAIAMTLTQGVAGGATDAARAALGIDFTNRQMSGKYTANQWNYRHTTTTTYDWDTLKCKKCTLNQPCTKTANPWFSAKYCKQWANVEEKCEDIQF